MNVYPGRISDHDEPAHFLLEDWTEARNKDGNRGEARKRLS